MATTRRYFRGPKDVPRNYLVLVLIPAPSRVALRWPRRSHDGAYSVAGELFCAGSHSFSGYPADSSSSSSFCSSHGRGRPRDNQGEADWRRLWRRRKDGHVHDQSSTKPWTGQGLSRCWRVRGRRHFSRVDNHRRIWQVARPSRSGLLMLCNQVTVFGGRVDMDESKPG